MPALPTPTPATEGGSPVPPARHRTGLITILFTDLVGSTALKQQVGDRAGASLMQQHHALVRELLREFPGGEEVETAGDSFLIVFTKPSDAVHFGLRLHARLRVLNQGLAAKLEDRIGIHVGEVVIREQEGSPNPKGLMGIQVDTCARVMGLAQGGQILLTRSAFDNARQMLKGEDVPGVGPLEWLNHGPYSLKGIEASLEVCEVGEVGIAPLQAPAGSDKAQRQVTPESEPVLGWRPALGQFVPNTRWRLETKLGEGGFGEVWLGRNPTTKERRVFKFCFQAERVRFLKRELTLFRLLKERIGDHPNLVRLHDVYLDQPPFYVEMDYVEGADLRTWSEERGGVASVPLETRLEIVAQAADGLQAAHEAGIIHRDIKPANILIGSLRSEAGGPRAEVSHLTADLRSPTSGLRPLIVKLTDFGIGQVVSEEYLAGITRAGFTQTILSDSSSSHTGTQLYMAPELLAGKPATIRSDIYSLGVVLYQLVVGDFTCPVTGDWSDDITDALLRDDLQHCLAGKPGDRFAGAGQLAKHLRALPERRAALEREQAELVARERAAYRRGIVRAASLAAVIVVVITALAIMALNKSRQAKAAAAAEKQQRQRSERHLYAANLNLAQQAWEQNNVGRVRQLLEETAAYPQRGFEWYYWQRQTRLELKTLSGHREEVRAVAYSPDGQRIVTGCVDGTAKVWEAATGKELLPLKGHRGVINSVAFSPDGQRIVTGGWDATAKVWETATGKELRTLGGHSNLIYSAVFFQDDQRIATASFDGTAKVWEAASGKELLTLRGHHGALTSVAVSPDGQRIVTGAWEPATRVWDAATGRELFTLPEQAISVAFSPDGRRILTGGGDQTAKVWEAADGKALLTLRGHSGRIRSVAFSSNGQRMVTGSEDQTAKVWDAASGKELRTIKGHGGGIESVAFSPDGQRIVTGSDDQTAKVWEVAGDRELINLKGHADQLRSVAFSPDGQRIVTGSLDGTAQVWEVANSRELVILRGHGDRVSSAVFTPDGERIVTGSQDGTARVWEVASGKALLTLRGHGNWVSSVAVTRDGQRIVTGSLDETAKVWEAASGRALLTLRGHGAGIRSVAVTPDGRRIVTGAVDGSARVWEAASGKELHTLKGHSRVVWSVAISPDGERILTGSDDNTAKVWDTVSGEPRLTLDGHIDGVACAVFSPDGRRMVTGSRDGTVKVWEAASGEQLLTLKGHSGGLWSAVFSPDGQRIATAGDDPTATVWTAATEGQLAAWQQEEKATAKRLAVSVPEQSTPAEQDRALRAHDPGAIKQWLVLAPIPVESRGGKGGEVEQEPIPQEATLRPRAGERVKLGQSERVWQAVQLTDYLLDFYQLLGEPCDWRLAYAVCYIQSGAEQKGLQVKVGFENQAKVYLNGRELYRHDESRLYVPDQYVVSGVELKAGLNIVVFKVARETTHGWLGSVRFTDAAGQPVKGIRVTLDPEGKN